MVLSHVQGEPFPVLTLLGYSDNGQLDVADATTGTLIVGVSDPVDNLDDPILIELDTDFIESLIGDGTYLGLLVLGDLDGGQIGWWPMEGGFETAPRLEIVYIPEPGISVILLLLVLILLLRRSSCG